MMPPTRLLGIALRLAIGTSRQVLVVASGARCSSALVPHSLAWFVSPRRVILRPHANGQSGGIPLANASYCCPGSSSVPLK